MKAKELAQQEGISLAAAQKRLQRAKTGQLADRVDKHKADCLEAERILWGKISHLEFMIDELQTQLALLGQPQPEARTQITSGELTYAPFEDL